MATYKFEKDFTSVNSAIREILEMSRALRQSKLKFFRECNNPEEIEATINRYGLSKIAQLWTNTVGDVEFVFKTHKNCFCLRKEGDLILAQWRVESEKSLKRSSAAKAAEKQLWDFPEYRAAEQIALEKKEEAEIGKKFLAGLKKRDPSIYGFSTKNNTFVIDAKTALCGLLQNTQFAEVAERVAIRQIYQVKVPNGECSKDLDDYNVALNKFAIRCREIAEATVQEDIYYDGPVDYTPLPDLASEAVADQ